MIVDFRKVTAPLPPLGLMDSPITIADSFRFLGTTITRDLKWEPTISSLIKKAQQRMFFLRQLRKLKLPPRMFPVLYGHHRVHPHLLHHRVVRWCHRQGRTEAAARRARCREGRRLRSIRTKTSRYMNSFFPSAIRLLNTK
ncbi:hypothetical protein D4764_07G0003780 [Takifugu flavidus]|uniref:Alkylated DNA repair protein AlkB homologue 8 N-terminal domain-containing protein n=1 Tax=Takifugu flavidus TaxID=433684 RepID=A0A5C6MSD4_9TELE|nr:hypothetical protein D4764_07G0003780 [Takifugu flavidus]